MTKYFLLALPAALLATPALGQHVEFSGRAHAGFSEFRGGSAAATTAIVTTNNGTSESSRATSPYGRSLGTGFGASVRAQRVGKTGLLTALDLGFDWLQARTEVDYIYYNSAVSFGRAASGTVRLFTPSVAAFGGAGWRLAGQRYALDALVGPELAYLFDGRERGDGASSVNGSWSSDVTRAPASRLDFRLRGDLTLWRSNLGLAVSYSHGFANYQPATTAVTSPDAQLRLLRVGLAFRLPLGK